MFTSYVCFITRYIFNRKRYDIGVLAIFLKEIFLKIVAIDMYKVHVCICEFLVTVISTDIYKNLV